LRDYEKLGAFYLGRRFDPVAGCAVAAEPLLYDAKDLTTHAVIVGMTGSGKTGLAVGLLEEAAIDGIPVIAIDPKGDLGNLLLAFPDLAAADFEPWIDPAEAARAGHSPAQHAAALAQRWREGLAEWDQEPARVARFADAAERVLYTPGSTAGRPLAALRSLAPPAPTLLADSEALRERVLGTVSSLLGLARIDADPLRSREHVLLSTLVERAWREGRSLDLTDLVREVQRPPVSQVGALDLETFFPSSDRVQLALALNQVIASPAFAAWSEGDPLEIPRLLYTDQGRPKLSVISIAHLSDAERMFAVTLLLSEIVGWMRTQPGSASLRAILYMDEVFGFFPPVSNPSSKTPMLTLLKQARAYGLGVVLATQNPVDLDYKGLANAGTWFLGRLQTERDKERVLEGLEGASAASGVRFDRVRVDALLSNLPKRVFLMSNAHEDESVLFQTRWALSYLAGPLTREQIRRLARSRTAQDDTVSGEAVDRGAQMEAAERSAPAAGETSTQRPILAPEIPESFLPAAEGSPVLYRPSLLGEASLHYVDAKTRTDFWKHVVVLAPLGEGVGREPWKHAREIGETPPARESYPISGASFAALPAAAARKTSFERWRKQLATHLYRSRPLRLLRCPELKTVSEPGESEGSFRARLRDVQRAQRDLELEKLRKRFVPQLARVRDQILRAEERVAREQSQYSAKKMQAAISIGATVVGALFGRKLGSATSVGRAATAARGVGRAANERDDIARATERTEELRARLAVLERDFEAAADRLEIPIDPAGLMLDETAIAPRKSDIDVYPVALVWVPERGT
jgi:DNA helicase HerA-like ATPase